MGPTATLVLGLIMRWIHITSVVILIGGVIYARFLCSYSPRFRNWIYLAMVGLLGSGLYNFLMKASYPPGYHMWFGIKMLLVLHIFATAILVAIPSNDERKRARRMTSIAAVALVVFLISSYLRSISLI